MKKRTFILLLLLQVFSLAVVAHPVSMTLAREVGAKFVNANTTTTVVAPNDLQWVTTYRTSSNDAAFHVFNLPEGWVIVAADNCATPILAYAETGSFDPNNLPPAMEDYLMGFVEQMEYSMVNLLPALDTVAHQWEIVQATGYLKDDRATTAVSPLLTTQWGQGDEGYQYNILCPSDSEGPNGHAVTGCAATAMAQIMRYWRYPQTGTGSLSYTPSNYPSQTQYVNFGNTTYDWDNMPNALTPSSTAAQNNAVAQLMWHCGVSVEMDYGATSSAASAFEVSYALPLYFRYSSDMHYDSRSGYSNSQWFNKIKTDLDNGRPILYKGKSTDSDEGHAFVCDGYNSSNQLHFNWGWYGMYQNTYFSMDALTPGSYNFNDYNAAIFNIHPLGPSYQVTLSANPTNGGSVSFDSKGDRGETTYDFDDGTLMGWTSIDADGDTYGWESSAAPYSYYASTVVLSGGGHNASEAYLVSGSYSNVLGVLTPDNYLVSPSKGRYSQLRFYACAQDINYAADHFGVAVSTTGNTNPSDFTTIQEWTMTAKSMGPQIMTAQGAGASAPGRGNNRSQGAWYQYVVDLSAYAGQDIWVAIRHFNCTDWFLIDIDDITLVTGGSGAISATFNAGQTCSVSARPSSGFYFSNWTENGVVVSEEANYSFVVNSACNLVANFTTEPPQYAQYPVTISASPDEGGQVSFGNKGDRYEFFYDFEDSSMMEWTTIDADGDGYDWMMATEAMGSGYGHNGSIDMVLSQSYNNSVGVLYPDNYLISPTMAKYSQISFYACAQDASYAAEHFGVAVSTNGNTNASDFVTIQEWTISAKGTGVPAPGRGGNRVQTNWYQYTVDLSAYAGQPIWVAIRHFNCSDMFYLDIDDITLITGGSSSGNSISATFTEGQWCTVNATPNSGYRFTSWTENGVVVSNAANYSFTVNNARNLVANFRPQDQQFAITISAQPENGGTVAFGSNGSTNYSQWYYYDDGVNQDAIGTGGGNFWWAIMIPAGSYTGNRITKVAAYDYMEMTGTASIYQGGTYQPASVAIGTVNVAFTGSNEFVEFTFNTPVTINPQENVWVVFYNESGATYPAAVCANTGDANGRWVSLDGVTWDDLAGYGLDYTFMIRAYIEQNNGSSSTAIYDEGETCTVTARPQSGYRFTNWTENGANVSTNANYTFEVNGNRNLVAVFSEKVPLPPTLQVVAEHYPEANNPISPYVKVSWETAPFEAQIGEGYSTSGYFPFYTLYNYSIAENLFLASELMAAGVTPSPMTSLSWYATNAPGYEQQGISIWMANVSDAELTTNSHTVDDMTLVYTGTMTPAVGWNEFVFNEGTFSWDGYSNVLIFCQRNNGEWNNSVQWQCSNVGFNAMSYRYQDSEAYDVNVTNTMYTSANRPNIIIKEVGTYAYNLYRANCNGTEIQQIADNLSATQYIDTEWLNLEIGNYKYGVSIVSYGREGTIYWAEPTTANSQRPTPEEAAAMGIKLSPAPSANTMPACRSMWNLLHSFSCTSGYQYGVASDGNYIYTSSWSENSSSQFYKYDNRGNFIEEFNVSGSGQIHDLTYDGQYFYGANLSGAIHCLDLANHTLVNTIDSEYGVMQCCTYDAQRDGFWVLGNWSGNLSLIDRNGTIQFTGPYVENASGIAYYEDENEVEHVLCFINSEEVIYDYNITANVYNYTPLFNFAAVPGYSSGIAGGCHIGEYAGKTAFFGDMQQSPNIIGIYELREAQGHYAWSNCIEKQKRVETQSGTLSKGWNWWSTYIEQEGIDGLGMLENSIGGAGIRIQGRDGNTDQYVSQGTSGWYGNLEAITNEQMYKIRTRAVCNAEITGYEANLADHPITINKGWNWIGFPNSRRVYLEEALSGFTPKAKDVIKGRNGVATYVVAGNYRLWYGTLTALEPGQGYMYKSFNNTPKTLVYQNGNDGEAVADYTNGNSSFTSNVEEFPTNMVVMATVEMGRQELRSEEYEVAAFVGNECRGSAKLMYIEPLDRYVAFLLVFGRMEEEIHFVLTDGDNAIWSNDVLTYSTDATEGNAEEPVTLHFGILGVDDNANDVVNIFPNPSNGVFNVEANGIHRIDVFNVYGQVILSEEVEGRSIQIDLGNNAAGMYLLRVVTDNGITTNQIIKTK